MDRYPRYLIALIVAIANSPLHIYDVHAWNAGTVHGEPWRTKVSTAARAVTSACRTFFEAVWGHRQGLAVAALLGLILLVPHPAHAHSVAMVGVAGSIAQMETDLKAVQTKAKTLLEATMLTCQNAVVTPASADGKTPAIIGRLMTKEEKGAIQAILDEGKALRGKLDHAQGDENQRAEIARLTDGLVPDQTQRTDPGRGRQVMKSLGQQFVDDAGILAWLKNAGARTGSAWTSPAVELMATTVDESAGSAGPLIITDYQPGILPLLFKRLVVADLLAPGTTMSNSITYMKETTFTNAAAAVAEGTTKPESTLVFAQQSDNVHKIAHWLPVTEEMLEDVEQIRSYIDARLRLGVALTEEDQLLNGSGVGANIQGLLNRAGLTAAQARGADSIADCLFKQITTIVSTVFIQPDAFVMNPINWQTVQLTKNANGNYLGTGPWQNAQPPQLWGYPGAITPSIVANTALVGAFKAAAQFFRRGGLRVEVSNSHSDFFVKNLVAIRAEERGALAVYRPAAFGTCTGLN